MAVTQTIFDGKVNLYQRGKAGIWQCATYLEDKNNELRPEEKNLRQRSLPSNRK